MTLSEIDAARRSPAQNTKVHVMNDHENSAVDPADILARAYVDTLAQAEGMKRKPMLKSRGAYDPAAQILDDLEPTAERDAETLRVDIVTAAVLTAKAIAAELGLAKRLRQEAPVVLVTTHTSELTDLVQEIMDVCATGKTQRKLIVARNGDDKNHRPDRGNNDVVSALNSRIPVVGVSPDPVRLLPSTMVRMAEYRVTIPAMDADVIRFVVEAITGMPCQDEISDELVRSTAISDLTLALRSGLTNEECLTRLERIVSQKNDHVGDGPSLSDLHGYGEAKEWGMALAADIVDYRAGRIPWEMVDSVGLLLSGAPGTGKTQFAKALAKTAGIPMIATSVATWHSATYLSGTLQAIREIFSEARRKAPCLVFIDEIDGISSREDVRGEYREYWVQITNLLLECLAGTEANRGVVVVAATNFSQRVDPAIRRSGRLDREIRIGMPDAATLAGIFRYHLGPELLAGVDLMAVALAAAGKTGADVEAYVRRAKATCRRNLRPITVQDLIREVRHGQPQLPENARRRVAIHEIGHAVVGRLLDVGNLKSVSIHDRGGEAEFDVLINGSLTDVEIEAVMAVFLAGRESERSLLGTVAIGGGMTDNSDLARATLLAEMLETKTGHGALGNVYLDGGLNGSPKLMAAVAARLDRAQTRAFDLIVEHRPVIERLAEMLHEQAYLSASIIDNAMADFAAEIGQKETAQ